MIVKCSALPTGQTLTASFYDTATSPEALIAAGQAFTEEGSTGVYNRDVTTTLDDYTIVRVKFSNGAEAWTKPGNTEVVSDPALLGMKSAVVEALNVDTYAEIGQESPAATQTIRKMLAYLYKFMRNDKRQTANQLSVLNDAGTVVDQKAAVSDDGTTFNSGKVGAGP